MKIATIILKAIQKKGLQYGIQIDVGEFPKASEIEANDNDPERASRLMAHAIARLAERVPFTRRISRHLEGTENKAGIASDVVAVGVELGTRNADVLTEALENHLSTLDQRVRAQRAQKAAAKNAPPHNNGGI